MELCQVTDDLPNSRGPLRLWLQRPETLPIQVAVDTDPATLTADDTDQASQHGRE